MAMRDRSKCKKSRKKRLVEYVDGCVSLSTTLPQSSLPPLPMHDDDLLEAGFVLPREEETSVSSATSNSPVWPSNEQDIVRHLINQQKFDGLWNADDTIINNLTGKSLSAFRSTFTNIDQDILASAIVIIMLETKFAGFSSLWHGVVKKARKRIDDLLKQDSNNVDTLIEDVHKQI